MKTQVINTTVKPTSRGAIVEVEVRMEDGSLQIRDLRTASIEMVAKIGSDKAPTLNLDDLEVSTVELMAMLEETGALEDLEEAELMP